MSKYYYESVGECVSQVYEVEADTWEEAKKAAFDDMKRGDRLAECPTSAVVTNTQFPEYHYLDKDQCTQYATLERGTWAECKDGEYWEARAWFFDDEPEVFYNEDFTEFTDWKNDQEIENSYER